MSTERKPDDIAEKIAAAFADALRKNDPDALVDGDPGSRERSFYIDGKFCLLDVARSVVTALKRRHPRALTEPERL